MKRKLFAMTMAAAVITSTVATSAATTFSDVPSNSGYAPYINDLHAKGILSGNGDGTFGPTDKLTRAQFAVMLTKAFNLPISSKTTKFKDSNSHWAKMYIESAYEAGLVAGTSDTTFSPDQSLTREQAAAMVWRYISAHGVSASPATNLTGTVDSWATDAVNNIVGHEFYGPGEVVNADYRAKDTMNRQEAAALVDQAMASVNHTSSGNPFQDPAPVSQWAVATLVKNSDGSYSTNSPQMPSSITNNYSTSQMQTYEAIFNRLKFTFNGDQCVVTAPVTGSDSLWWSFQDDHGDAWEGSSAKTMTLTSSRGVGIGFFDHDSGHVLVKVTIFNNGGQWTAKVLMN